MCKCVVLCCFVKYVEIYTEQRELANSISAEKSYQLLREVYGERFPSQETYERRFPRFKSSDFDKRQEGGQETWKIVKKIRKCEITSIVGRR